jgi:hypothetical protein
MDGVLLEVDPPITDLRLIQRFTNDTHNLQMPAQLKEVTTL